MPLTKVTSGVRTLGTGEVATANMAVDPTNADNLASGSVPSARLGNVDTAGLEDDIALLGFKVAANGSLAKYNLVDQTIDDFQDASGVNASSSTSEERDATGKYYYGVSSGTPTVTGGTITTYGDYTIHSFLTGADFVTDTAMDVDVLLVAGGGGGGGSGGNHGGGGGGGGVRVITGSSVTAATHAVVVGGGGASGSSGGGAGGDGVASSFNSINASGGGGGGGGNASGRDGGSGGGTGGGGASKSPGSGNAGGYSPVEGYAGAPDFSGNTGNGAGGGGGASEVGDGASQEIGGDGGDGIQNAFRTNSNVYYGGGGGGGGNANGGGSNGGGGAGGSNGGTTNTGGGGGGGRTSNNSGGAGGSGIVVIKRLTQVDVEGGNMSLVSNTTAAQAAPTKGDIVLTYTNGTGTTTLDTDLTAEISADGGSTWTALALTSEGSTGSHNIATSHDVTITSTITAPYNMAYRIKTLNQSASKTTRIQAVSLGWS